MLSCLGSNKAAMVFAEQLDIDGHPKLVCKSHQRNEATPKDLIYVY